MSESSSHGSVVVDQFGVQYLSVILIIVCLILVQLRQTPESLSQQQQQQIDSTEVLTSAEQQLLGDTREKEGIRHSPFREIGYVTLNDLFDRNGEQLNLVSYQTLVTFYSSHDLKLFVELYPEANEQGEFTRTIARSIALQRQLLRDGYLDSDIRVLASLAVADSQASVRVFKREGT